MNGVALVWLAILLVIFVRSLMDLASISSNVLWLKKGRKVLSADRSTRFVICIPALYEQDIIVDTLDRILSLDYPKTQVDIYVVTTSKEQGQKNSPTTNEVVEKYRSLLPGDDKTRLHILNYPKADGRMAHQINFAATRAADFLKEDNCYFVVYNADSIIKPDALVVVNETIHDIRKHKKRYPRILQQSAVYSYDFNGRWFESSIAKGAAMHQSRWTLTHELTRLRKQSQNIEKLRGNSPLNSIMYAKIAHCVGHGLFVQGLYYLKNPLPTDILNEDLPYGLMQCALRNEIYPLPTLELATSPTRLMNLYRQKTVWFNPFFEFHTCIKNLLATGGYKSVFEVYLLGIQAYTTMIIWLLHSAFWNIGLVLSAVLGWQYLLFWAAAFVCYWVIPSIIYHVYVRGQEIYSCFSISSLLLGSLYVLSHSTGPILCSVQWVRASVMGIRPTKPKTVST